jgi:hypothetical protein
MQKPNETRARECDELINGDTVGRTWTFWIAALCAAVSIWMVVR